MVRTKSPTRDNKTILCDFWEEQRKTITLILTKKHVTDFKKFW